MTNDVFIDTAGWGNYFVRTEPFNEQAKNYMRRWQNNRSIVLTTNYIILELIALFTSPLRISRKVQIDTIETIKACPWIEIVHIDPTLDR